VTKAEHTSPFNLTFSSSYSDVSYWINYNISEKLTLYGAYHFASRVLPLNVVNGKSSYG